MISRENSKIVRSEDTPITVSSNRRLNKKGFKIEPEVIDFSEYDLNPRMLAEHQDQLAIGRMYNREYITTEDGYTEIQFIPVFDTTEKLGETWKQKYIEGFVNGASIGGICKLSDDKKECLEFIVDEISLTTNPADWDALAKFELSCNDKRLKTKQREEGYQYEILSFNISNDAIIEENEETRIKNLTKNKANTMLKNERASVKMEGLEAGEKPTGYNDIHDPKGENKDMTPEEKKIEGAHEDNMEHMNDDSDADFMCDMMTEEEYDAQVLAKESKKEESSSKKSAKKMSAKEWEAIKKEKIYGKDAFKKDSLSFNPNMKTYETKAQNQTRVLRTTDDIYNLMRKEDKASGDDRAGMEWVNKKLHLGTDEERLMIVDAIRNNRNGRAFFDNMMLNIMAPNNGDAKSFTQEQIRTMPRIARLSATDYLFNKGQFGSDLHEVANQGRMTLNQSTNFIADPALDRIIFASLAFLKLFPNNDWASDIPIFPVQESRGGVGIVFPNIIFTPVINTQAAQTYITNPAVNAPINMFADTAVSVQMYEHIMQPITWRQYNEEIVAYPQMAYQLQVAMESLNQRMCDWDIYQIANAINTVAPQKFNTLTGTATTVSDWPLLPAAAGTANGISYNDTVAMQRYLQSTNVNMRKNKCYIAADSWLYSTFLTDPTATTVLNRYVSGNDHDQILKSNAFMYHERSYYGRFDTATNTVVAPGAATTATQVQFGMVVTPEYLVRAIVPLEVFAWISPQLYGEVYSMQMKSGATAAYKADARGNALIIPTVS